MDLTCDSLQYVAHASSDKLDSSTYIEEPECDNWCPAQQHEFDTIVNQLSQYKLIGNNTSSNYLSNVNIPRSAYYN
jgi:hypothetical protein